jgi:uncharacterized membrane protein YcjF (UPF0283 family)
MGDRHHDPTDHFRTTQSHAGFTMISTTAAAAYGHYDWLATTSLVAVLGTVAGTLWFVVEYRRVARIDERWQLVADADTPPRQRAASKEPTGV